MAIICQWRKMLFFSRLTSTVHFEYFFFFFFASQLYLIQHYVFNVNFQHLCIISALWLNMSLQLGVWDWGSSFRRPTVFYNYIQFSHSSFHRLFSYMQRLLSFLLLIFPIPSSYNMMDTCSSC